MEIPELPRGFLHSDRPSSCALPEAVWVAKMLNYCCSPLPQAPAWPLALPALEDVVLPWRDWQGILLETQHVPTGEGFLLVALQSSRLTRAELEEILLPS